MSAGTYTGNGSTNRAIAHQLSAAPDFCTIINIGSTNQYFYDATSSPTQAQQIGSGNTVTGLTVPTATNFYVSGNENSNTQSYEWVCWLDSTAVSSGSTASSATTSVFAFSPYATSTGTSTPTLLYTFTAGDIMTNFLLFTLVSMHVLGFILRTNA